MSGPGQEQLSWRVNPTGALLKGGAAVAFVLAALVFAGDPVGVAVALLAAVALGAYALRDVIAPVRLAADTSGLTVVSGYAGRRRLAWSDVDRVRVDSRRRLGLRNDLLEIDTDDHLYLFSSAELGADCAEVAQILADLRERATLRPSA